MSALRVALPAAVIHHSPNEHRAGGAAARRVQGIRSGMGLCRGWCDLVVLAQGRVLFLEVKGPRGRLSPAQEAFRDRVLAQGHHWALVRSVDDALEAAASAGLVVRARVAGGRT
ncbi:VRR-NUC domain-containing protein [Paracoccus sp. SMMA_5]|uniref:VRR-NUC domain-containing protein n=1 Tax=Paracoccus sp. SMMA_5 TaxID=2654281 RepID=UPI002E0F3FAE